MLTLVISLVNMQHQGGGGTEGGSRSFYHAGDAGIYEGKWPSSALQHPRDSKFVAAVVRGLWPLITDYSSTTETAVQQPFTLHTPSGGRRI